MGNEIRIVVKMVDQASNGFESFKREANMTASDVEGMFGRTGKKMGESISSGVKSGTDRARDEFGRFASSVGSDLEKGVKHGTDGAKKELDKLGKSDGGASLGSRLKDGITNGITKGFLEGGIPAVAQFGIYASPLLGGLLSAGIVGGAGLGGILGGVMLAAKDPAVQSAGKELGSQLMGHLGDDAQVFVQPVLAAIDQVGQGFETRLRPKIQSIFKNSANFLGPLTEGIMTGVDGLLAGLDKAVSRAGPVMHAIGDLFANVGTAVGRMFDTVSGGSDDAAKALDDLGALLSGVIIGLGYVIRGLTEFYGVLHDTGEGIGDFINKISGVDKSIKGDFVPHVAEAASGALGFSQNLTLMGMHAAGAEGPIATLTDQIDSFSAAGRSAFSATTNMAEALDAASQAAKKNGKTLDENTEKGRANRTALSRLADAAIATYDATVKLNGEGEKSNGVANENRRSFIKSAMAMGESRAAAERLADQLGLIKAPKPIKIVTNSDAQRSKLRELQEQINRMRGRTIPITVRVTTKGETLYGNQAPQMNAHGGIKGAASGMNTSGLTWVGEHGPELVSLPAGTSIRSNPDSMRLAAAQSSGGPSNVIVNFDYSRIPVMVQGILEGLRFEVRGQGGNVQDVLGVAGA